MVIILAIRNFFDATWLFIGTITMVGYGDIIPQITLGRIMDMIIMPIGITVISILTILIATILTERGYGEDKQHEVKQ